MIKQKIGVPKEIKNMEFRVGATPTMVMGFVEAGHSVFVEKNAGARIGYSDEMYQKAGAKVVPTAKQVYESDLIIKVKEPQNSEFPLMHEGQVLFCYLHLAPDAEQTRQLIERKVVAIAYETVEDKQGRLPLLTPMSEIAGRISVQAGAYALQMANGGRGVLLGGVPGVKPAEVVIIGGGVVGTNAAQMAMGLGADVTILDRDLDRLRLLDMHYGGRLKTLYSSPQIIGKLLRHADLIIGAVLIPGKKAPSLVSKEMLKDMKAGSVLVDVSIDQGGCFETSMATTHSEPTYIVDDVVHYCVANMPGACARSATQALTNATYPYAIKIANLGYKQALSQDPLFMKGLNVHHGKVTNAPVAKDLGYEYVDPSTCLQ
ncbi:MAG: Alanine dehydrogenase [Chlamydiia bacterium]|nr:Alanine dehydrogenase [Chlamydiia bacterium]MCH9618527.1 Alanine dehydrogenase [Chlamydiia bacterium]